MMSNIIFITTPVEGHFNPTRPIARNLIKKGHKVVWITGSRFKEKIENLGATFKPFPEKWDPGEKEWYDFFPELKNLNGISQAKYYIKNIFLDMCADVNDTIDEVLKDYPADMLVGDITTYITHFKSEMEGIPCAIISLLPLSISSRDTAPYGLGMLPGKTVFQKIIRKALRMLFNNILSNDLVNHGNLIRKSFNLPNLEKPFSKYFFESPALILQTTVPSFEYPRSDLPDNVHFIGPVFFDTVQDYQFPVWWDELKGNKPVVLVNQGTVGIDLKNLILPAIEGLKNEDVLIIAVPAAQEDIPEVPDNVHVEKFIPHSLILPYVNIMVTNGGYGGTQKALTHGIPLLMAGTTEDKMEVAARVEWVGAGINLRKKQPTPQEIKAGVKEILSNSLYRENAEKIKADFAKYDAPTRAVELIESVLKEV